MNEESGPVARKPDLDEYDPIEYDTDDVGYAQLLLWPAVVIGALGLLALAASQLNFLGPY